MLKVQESGTCGVTIKQDERHLLHNKKFSKHFAHESTPDLYVSHLRELR